MAKVLVACEFSQVVTKAFRKLGHEAYSCDILPCEGGHPEWHIQGDVLKVLDDRFDLLIAHPPCTRLANSGVQWLNRRNLWDEMRAGANFFRAFLEAPIKHIAVENPIPHKYALEIIGRKYDQTIQPWQFGHPESKATCLWLRNLPKLQPTSIVAGREQRMWKLPPSADRWKLRSITYQGIADAMAQQWSAYLSSEHDV